jgi:RNA polymerase sigma-70 factor (ECF subfamily)
MTDDEAIQCVQAGDPEAFAILVHGHYAACLGYARSLLGRREPAEDAVQETFLRAFRAIGRYDHRNRFRAWLFQILVNRCRSAWRHEQRRGSDDLSLDDLPAGAHPTTPPEDVVTRTSVEAALRRLGPDQREAFLLHHVEQMSYEEMAFATGAGISALKMRVARARESLRQELEHGHESPRG